VPQRQARSSLAIRATVPVLIPSALADLRMPFPACNDRRTAASRFTSSFGLPIGCPLFVPLRFARATPARTRSRIIAASNSANSLRRTGMRRSSGPLPALRQIFRLFRLVAQKEKKSSTPCLTRTRCTKAVPADQCVGKAIVVLYLPERSHLDALSRPPTYQYALPVC
jgi:hypothetical protein